MQKTDLNSEFESVATLLTRKDNFLRKSKEISLQAWTGPEDSRRLRLPDFKTIGT